MKKKYILILFLFTFYFSHSEKLFSQASFVTSGNASSSGGGCYVLTPATTWQKSAAWDNTPINLSQPLTIEYNLNFGNRVAQGADGIAFVLQNQGTGVVGAAGLGIGYDGITPSVIVEFDSYYNWQFDPASTQDHAAVNLNGDPDHTSAANSGNPMYLFPNTIKDGNWHSVKITWDPVTKTLQVYFDCQLVLTYTKNIVNTIFGGNPNVWWGFTSSTGTRWNLQQFCYNSPITMNTTNSCSAQCNGTAAVVNFIGGTPPYTYQWSSGQTTSSISGLCAGNYTVTVTNATGCTAMDSVTVNQSPILNANASVVNNVSCFGGNNGSATVVASGGTSPYSYSWSSGQTQQTATSLSAGTNTITVTDNSGCAITQSITITQPPAITATVSGTPSICFGENDTLNVASGSGTYTYLWNPGNATTTAVILSPASSINYSVTVTDANGCSTMSTFSVTVNPVPVCNFIFPGTCLNNATSFSDQSAGATQWLWNFGEPSSGPNNTSVLQSPTHIYSSVGTFSVTLIAYNSSGCSDTLIKTLTVNPLPFVGFGPTTVCVGTTSQFTDLSSISSGNLSSWQWNFGDPSSAVNNISNLQNPTHYYSTSGIYNVLLTVTSDSGCQGSLTLPVTVNPPPVANFSAVNACFSSANTYIDASQGASQWYWQFGDMTTSNQQNPAHTYTASGTYTVTLIVASAFGCKDTLSDTVNVYPLPNPDFTADTVCPGNPTSFSDISSISSGSITSWNWNFGDGNNSAQQNPTHIYSVSGTYNVSLVVTSNNNCTKTISSPALVYAAPTAGFSVSPQEVTDLTQEISLANLSSADAVQWWWSFGDNSFENPNNANPSHQYADTGQYVITLVVVNQHGCRDTINEPMIIREFSFYIPNAFTPNNDNDNETFFGKGIGIKDYTIRIFDRWGNLIWNCHKSFPDNSGQDGLPSLCQWNGKVQRGANGELVQEDVYVWKADLLDIFNKEHHYIGNVSVVK